MNDDSSSKTKTTELTNEDWGRFHRRISAMDERFRKGSLDFDHTMAGIQDLLDGKVKPLLPSPIHQMRIARMMNKVCKWGIDDYMFEYWSEPIRMAGEPTNTLRPMRCVVLDIHLESPEATFEAAWNLIGLQREIAYTNAHRVNVANIKTLTTSFVGKSLRWRWVDFGANAFADQDGRSVAEVRASGKELPESAILWALVYNPKLLEDLQLLGVHRVWMTGYGLKDLLPDEYVPVLNHDQQSGHLEISLGSPGNKSSKRSIPEYFYGPR